MKWFKIWGVKDILELLGDIMKYVIIEDRLLEAPRMKWQDAKISKLECYIANIDPQCWPQYKEKMSERIQLHLPTP